MLRRRFLAGLAELTGGWVVLGLAPAEPALARVNLSRFAPQHRAAGRGTCGDDVCATADVCASGDAGHTCTTRDVCDVDVSRDCTGDRCGADSSGACTNDGGPACSDDGSYACSADLSGACQSDSSGECSTDGCVSDNSSDCVTDRCIADSSGACTLDGGPSDSTACPSDLGGSCISDKSGDCGTDGCVSDKSGSCTADGCVSDSSNACQTDSCVSDKSGICISDRCDSDKSGTCIGDQCDDDASASCTDDACSTDAGGTCAPDRCVADASGACSVADLCVSDESSTCSDDLCRADQSLTDCATRDTCALDLAANPTETRRRVARASLNAAMRWLYQLGSILVALGAVGTANAATVIDARALAASPDPTYATAQSVSVPTPVGPFLRNCDSDPALEADTNGDGLCAGDPEVTDTDGDGTRTLPPGTALTGTFQYTCFWVPEDVSLATTGPLTIKASKELAVFGSWRLAGNATLSTLTKVDVRSSAWLADDPGVAIRFNTALAGTVDTSATLPPRFPKMIFFTLCGTTIFEDDFEYGDLDAWTARVP